MSVSPGWSHGSQRLCIEDRPGPPVEQIRSTDSSGHTQRASSSPHCTIGQTGKGQSSHGPCSPDGGAKRQADGHVPGAIRDRPARGYPAPHGSCSSRPRCSWWRTGMTPRTGPRWRTSTWLGRGAGARRAGARGQARHPAPEQATHSEPRLISPELRRLAQIRGRPPRSKISRRRP
jgi:hypothetical protein